MSAFPLQRSGGRIDDGEIAARRILNFKQLARHLSVAFLSQDVHQRNRPLPPFRICNDLALDVLPVVHAPRRHIYAINSPSPLPPSPPVNAFATSHALRSV